MARKQTRISGRMLFSWFMLASIIFLLAPQNFTNKFQFAFARLFRWPLGVGRNISLSARPPKLPAGTASRREAQLRNYIATLQEQLRQKQKRIQALSRLREKFYDLEGAGLMIADVLTAPVDASHGQLVINRGSDDGLDQGQFVLGDNSIIGRISDVDKHQARVRLFTDPASKIEVKIAGIDLYRVMEGIGNNSAKIPMVLARYKVKRGLWVYARAKPSRLNAPIVVGVVAECKKDDDKPFLWDITVEPACDLGQLKYVAVIIMNP